MTYNVVPQRTFVYNKARKMTNIVFNIPDLIIIIIIIITTATMSQNPLPVEMNFL